jgi:hypothetical protein
LVASSERGADREPVVCARHRLAQQLRIIGSSILEEEGVLGQARKAEATEGGEVVFLAGRRK